MKLFTFFFVFFMLFAFALWAQPKQYLFSSIDTRSGLHDEDVHTLQQDEQGYLWIASYNSLQRYDGHRFVNFTHQEHNPKTIPRGTIRSMLIDKKNRLWLLTSKNSMGWLDVNTFTFTPVKIIFPADDFTNTALVLQEDKDGHIILIAVGKTFLTYNENLKEVSQKHNPFTLPQGWEPLFFWQDHDRNYWVGSQLGLLKYNTAKKMMSYKGHNTEQDAVIKKFENITTVVSAFMDKQHCFWISAWPGGAYTLKSFNLADGSQKSWEQIIGNTLNGFYYELNGITETKDGNLWMAGQNLLARINKQEGNIQPVFSNAAAEYSIRYDGIRSLFEDREKNIWVCTNKGLFRFNPSAQLFTKLQNRLPQNKNYLSTEVTAFLQTTGGEILVSTWGNGVFSYDTNFAAVNSRYINRASALGEGMVWCMLQLPNGDIWRGQQDGYLFIYDAAAKITKKIQPPIFERSTIRQMDLDKNGNIWLGTQRGFIVKYNVATQTFSCLQKLKSIINRIYIDSKNYVWVCTDLKGVFKINATDGSIVATYNNNGLPGQYIPENYAADVIQYDDSTMLIASDGLNILNLRTNRFKYFNDQNGLPASNITNLIKDKRGYIWMSTSTGIISYHPVKSKLSTYNAADGVYTKVFNIASSALLNDGRILFGSNHDFILFDPAIVTVTDYTVPKVTITGFAVMNKFLLLDSISKLPVIQLPHAGHSLTIQLATLNHQNIYGIYYIMEGLDKEWTIANGSSQAIYNHLPPGNYIFKTACRDVQGNLGSINFLSIKINAPFWRTGWFFGLIALLLGTLLFWLDRERMLRKETVQKMRTDIAANLHQEVNTALGNINILSEMAKLKADKEPAKSKEFIEQIHNKSHNLIIAMDDMLWSINPENDRMQKTVERMREYIDALNNRHNANIVMLVEDTVNALKLSMQFRHEAFILFKESINGLVKAGATDCKIYVAMEKGNLQYSVQFNNAGCDMQQLNNLLHNQDMGNRLKAIKATVEIEMHKTNSILILKVPVA